MSRYIATRLHQALELAPDDAFLRRCATLPHYVIDSTLRHLLTRGDVRASINAMIEADIARLPFAEMLIEFDASDKDNARSFVVLEEYQGRFRAFMGVHHTDGAFEADPWPMVLELGVEAVTITADKESHPTWQKVAGIALSIALLMLNIQGVEKEVIEPSRLNRQREGKGKASIPRHTVMRIGHVYGSDGRKHSVDGGGRHMPVHLRAGHARRQHYGEGNAETKIIYIPPVLVNFKPGAEVRQPKRVLAA